MNDETRLKVQALVDGALSPAESAEITRLLAADPAAQKLSTELTGVRTLLRSGEILRPVPETRDFYWSKIAREIRSAPAPAQPARTASRPAGGWLRWLVPATLVLAAVFTLVRVDKPGAGDFVALGQDQRIDMAQVPSFSFRSEAAAMSVVWVETENILP